MGFSARETLSGPTLGSRTCMECCICFHKYISFLKKRHQMLGENSLRTFSTSLGNLLSKFQGLHCRITQHQSFCIFSRYNLERSAFLTTHEVRKCIRIAQIQL
jgi:hypothetical protein